MDKVAVMLVTVVIYFLILLWIGYYSWKKSINTPEDYFVAGRSLGVITLLVGILATNMSAFGIVGFPTVAYKSGVGALGYAPSAMWLAAVAIYVFCYRAWLLGRKYGYITPSEILTDRVGSAAGYVLFVIYTVFTIPYLMTGVIGSGVMFSSMTGGVIPYWLGCFIPYAVVLFYVMFGGMRGQMWTNVVQGLVFATIFLIGTFFVFGNLGGVSHVFKALQEEAPELLQRTGNFDFRVWTSYVLITFPAVATYPWVFIRSLTSRSDKVMKTTLTLYPLAYFIAWFPPILIAIAGILVFPGLTGTDVDNIIPLMMDRFFPSWAAGIALAGILAAMMSTLDAQLLTLSTMLTRDLLVKKANITEKQQVWYGRLFVIILASIGFILSLFQPATVFDVFNVAATGFIGLAPVLFGMLYWKRMNRYGAIASMLTSVLLSYLFFAQILPPAAALGFLPMVPVLIISALVMVVVSLVTPPESAELADKFFKVFEKVYNPSVDLQRPKINLSRNESIRN